MDTESSDNEYDQEEDEKNIILSDNEQYETPKETDIIIITPPSSDNEQATDIMIITPPSSDNEEEFESDNEEEFETDNEEEFESDTSGDYERTFKQRGDGVIVETTFINNKYKLRINPGICVRGIIPKTGTKNTPSKNDLFKCLILKQKYYQNTYRPSIRKFREKYINYEYGYKQWINKCSYRTWTNYHQEYKITDIKYKKLQKLHKKFPKKKCKKIKRFYKDPFEEHYGVCPIFEEFLVKFRSIIGAEYEWRSVTWFLTEAQRFIKHQRLLKLLRAFMENQEIKLLKLLRVTRWYIHCIMVYMSINKS